MNIIHFCVTQIFETHYDFGWSLFMWHDFIFKCFLNILLHIFFSFSFFFFKGGGDSFYSYPHYDIKNIVGFIQYVLVINDIILYISILYMFILIWYNIFYLYLSYDRVKVKSQSKVKSPIILYELSINKSFIDL